MVYIAINGPIYLTKLISRGYIVPDDEDHREYWSRRLPPLLSTSNNNSNDWYSQTAG